MSESATPLLDRPVVIKEGESLFLDLEGILDEAPTCEALPGGKNCFREAEYVANITSHGCRRDGIQILLCSVCYKYIAGGAVCAICEPAVEIWIASARAL